MAKVITEDRGSVVYNGRIIRRISEIPSEAELAVGNPAEEKKAENNILAEMERLKAELELLKKDADDAKKAAKKKSEVVETSA
jgi:hypothetical protein